MPESVFKPFPSYTDGKSRMPILIISAVFAALFLLLGLVGWGTLRLFGSRGHAGRTFKIAGFAYLVMLPLLLGVGTPLILSYLVVNASTRPMDQILLSSPENFGRAFTPVSFRAIDGPLIRGWWMDGDPSLPPIIYAHGLFRNRQELLERACRLNELGYPSLLIDLRSHGESEAAPISLGFQERQDVLGARQFLRHRQNASQCVYFGVSMGAVACLMAAADQPADAAGLILDSPFDSLSDTVARHVDLLLGLPAFPAARIFTWNLGRMAGFDPAQDDALRAAASLGSLPTLLIYGKNDRRMPPEVAQRVFDALPTPEKRLVFVEGADHGAAFKADPELYLNTVREFLDSLPKRPPN